MKKFLALAALFIASLSSFAQNVPYYPTQGASGPMTLLQTVVGTGGSSVISFTNIPQTYNHLKVLIGGSGNSGGSAVTLTCTFNSDTGYDYVQAYVSNGTFTSGGAFSIVCGVLGAQTPVSGGSTEINVPVYALTGQKSISFFGFGVDGVTATVMNGGGSWGGSATAPITSMQINVPGNFQSGDVASLYGIK